MGQYWKAVLEQDDKLKVIDPMDYGDGWKLMEHSYFGNSTVLRVIDELKVNEARVWWVGDYYHEGFDGFRADVKEAAWGDEDTSIDSVGQGTHHTSPIVELSGYLVNHTKKEYVDMRKCFLANEYIFSGRRGWCVEPLPLLTATSNDLGSGDYHEGCEDYKSVGIWAGDVISFSSERPDYTERTVGFLEAGCQRVAKSS